MTTSNQEDSKLSETNNTPSKTLNLCKSFRAEYVHGTSYTGGKVITTSTPNGIPSLQESNHQLLALCAGDVSIMDAQGGIQTHTIRTGIQTLKSTNDHIIVTEDDEDDEMMDMDSILTFALSSKDDILVTASRNHLLRIYNLKEEPFPKLVQTIARAHEAPIKHMEFHPSNAFLVTGSVDGVVKVWDMRPASPSTLTSTLTSTSNNNSNCFLTHCYKLGLGIVGGISVLAWAPSSYQNTIVLAMGFENGRVDLVDLMHSSSEQKSKVQYKESDLITTTSGGILVMGGIEAHVSTVTDMVWAGESHSYFVTVGRDEVINIWSIDINNNNNLNNKNKNKNKRKQSMPSIIYKRIFTHPIYEHIESIQILYSSSTSFHLATAGSKGQIRVWDIITSNEKTITNIKCIHTQTNQELSFGEERGGYTHILLEQQNKMILVDAHHNFTYYTYTPSYQLQPNRTIVGHNDEIIDVKVLSPHNKIAVATNSPQIRLFDFSQTSISCYATLNGHTDILLCMDVSIDGCWIASAGKDRSMILWDTQTKRYD